jgi:hypothetical protein
MKKMVALNISELQRLAFDSAKDAHENYFSSRRGIWLFEDNGIVCVYNNNPYADDAKRRDRETAAFRARMKAARIREVAYATYPPAGKEDAGYTYALLLKADDSKLSFIAEALRDTVVEALTVRGFPN